MSIPRRLTSGSQLRQAGCPQLVAHLRRDNRLVVMAPKLLDALPHHRESIVSPGAERTMEGGFLARGGSKRSPQSSRDRAVVQRARALEARATVSGTRVRPFLPRGRTRRLP